MGFSHYWIQINDFTEAEWEEVRADIGEILKHAQYVQDIPLANGAGEPKTAPVLNASAIIFNGLGDRAYEGFKIRRLRAERDSCKTSRHPYDLVVCACLSYLATVRNSHRVTSDGNGSHWLPAVCLARQALPRYANILDIPMPIMQNDRWTFPRIEMKTLSYDIQFCIDGHGYVIENTTKNVYAFPTHSDLARWLDATKCSAVRSPARRLSFGCVTPECEPNIWDATGGFDEKRHHDLADLQTKCCEALFASPTICNVSPPAFVRPGEYAEIENPYRFEQLVS